MSKQSSTTKKKNKVTQFKCDDCDFVAKAKGGLTTHINHKHKLKVPPAIGDRTATGTLLSPPEEAFCQLYASDAELFGNGVQSYIEAYKVKIGKGKGMTSYEYCRYAAHKLLTRKKILDRINQIFEGRGLNDAFVDKQLEKLITQDAEFNPKIKAIVEYNKLKKRTVDTVEHKHAFADIKGMSDEELAREKERLLNFFNKK